MKSTQKYYIERMMHLGVLIYGYLRRRTYNRTCQSWYVGILRARNWPDRGIDGGLGRPFVARKEK